VSAFKVHKGSVQLGGVLVGKGGLWLYFWSKEQRDMKTLLVKAVDDEFLSDRNKGREADADDRIAL
jgi:hypothetical protein